MKLVIGLGNQGSEYSRNRHNVGFLVVEELQRLKLPSGVVVAKSFTYMNDSGEFVERSVAQYKTKLNDLYIVHDDLDIKLGEFKIQFGRGPKDHNGLKSVDDILGTNQYWHVRIGIDNRPFDNRPMGEEYVLQNFTNEEREILDRTIKKLLIDLIALISK